jgi:acyl dehydratase
MDTVEKKVRFSEDRIESWCNSSEDQNPLHLDKHEAGMGPFGERIAPGMMVLDYISGMLSELADDDEHVILAGVTAARFRDPILVGETVTLRLTDITEDNKFTSVDFEAVVEERGSLVANGVLSIVVE